MSHTIKVNGVTLTCVNEDEDFWGLYYQVSFAQCLGWDSSILVNAGSEQDALDYAADYAEEQGWMGYFLGPADKHTKELEDAEEVIYLGNHCLPVPSEELHYRQVHPDKV